MGEQQRRERAIRRHVTAVHDYVNAYLSALKEFTSDLPTEIRIMAEYDIAELRRAELWPCRDGIVVLVFRDAGEEISIEKCARLTKTVNEFLRSPEQSILYDDGGNRYPFEIAISFQDFQDSALDILGAEVKGFGKLYRTRYQLAMVIGLDAPIPEPAEVALRDVRRGYAIQNLHSSIDEGISTGNERGRAQAERIEKTFTSLLGSETLENELQLFLENNPRIMYPDLILVKPQFPLGSEYVTDFVILVRGHHGLEYVFVEIERPSKSIFTKSGQFSSHFTQAKDQLLNWERWVTTNHDFIVHKLPGFYKAKYHLIMGRRLGFSATSRKKIHDEFEGTNRTFSTYDDLLERFRDTSQYLFPR